MNKERAIYKYTKHLLSSIYWHDKLFESEYKKAKTLLTEQEIKKLDDYINLNLK